MPRKGKRIRLARGVYQDSGGRAGIISVNSKPVELRFPHRTPIAEIKAKMAAELQKRKGSGKARASRDTFAAAVDRWSGFEQHLASWKERRAELRAWVALIGPKRIAALDADDVRRAIGAWTKDGLAPKTIRNRLWTFKHLYAVLFGSKAETPGDDVEPPAKVRTVINPTPVETILAVYARLLEFEQPQAGERPRLLDAKTRARYMVRASTGKRPVEIMRAQPEDLDLERRIWRVRDAKGGWSEGLYLNDDMLVAWQTFAAADAWGPFNTGSMAEVLRAAGWPSERDANGRYRSRPYNLRHSIGIGLSELGHDLDDVGGWLGHRPGSRMTREHYVPVLESRMQRLSESITGRLNGWQVPRNEPRTEP